MHNIFNSNIKYIKYHKMFNYAKTFTVESVDYFKYMALEILI